MALLVMFHYVHRPLSALREFLDGVDAELEPKAIVEQARQQLGIPGAQLRGAARHG